MILVHLYRGLIPVEVFLYHKVTWGIAGIIPGRDDSFRS